MSTFFCIILTGITLASAVGVWSSTKDNSVIVRLGLVGVVMVVMFFLFTAFMISTAVALP